MSENKKKLKSELSKLIKRGKLIRWDIAISDGNLSSKQKKVFQDTKAYMEFKKDLSSHKSTYQKWFTLSYSVVKQLLPDRHSEFYGLYRDEKRKNSEIDSLSFTISDYFLGFKITRGGGEVVNRFAVFFAKMEVQITILESCIELLDSKLANIEGVLQYELFETELHAAKDLLKKKYNRAAGALAGVTLEIHLAKVCSNNSLTFRKANPTISNFNEALKDASIIDMPTWRLIQRLGDIRNLSVHSKDREPTSDEVEDLIRGCEKLISELN